MNRRTFVASAAASIAARPLLRAQKMSQTAKLERLSLMTIAWNAFLKVPGYTAKSDQSLDIVDVPEMFADRYGIHSIELQYEHVPVSDPAVMAEFLARVKKAHSRVMQINVENAATISSPEPERRDTIVGIHKGWIDRAAEIGCPRVMINQGRQLTEEKLAYTIPTLKQVTEYARSKNIKLCMETRTPSLARRNPKTYGVAYGPEVMPPPPAWVRDKDTRAAWELSHPFVIPDKTPPVSPAASNTPPDGQNYLLGKLAKGAGAYVTVDIDAMSVETNKDMEDGVKMLLPLTSGAVHINYQGNPGWDLPTVIRTFGKLGYKGQFTMEIEHPPDPYACVAGIREVLLENI